MIESVSGRRLQTKNENRMMAVERTIMENQWTEDPSGPNPDKHKYDFEEFVKGASKQICEAVEK